jgi:hypothetical protein
LPTFCRRERNTWGDIGHYQEARRGGAKVD